MRIVIENGKEFSKINFFMMIKELSHEHIVEKSERFFKILTDDLGVTHDEIENFLNTFTQRKQNNILRSSKSFG